MRVYFPLLIGIIFFGVGAWLLSDSFASGNIKTTSATIEQKYSDDFRIDLDGKGIGFYKISILGYDKTDLLYVQVLDPRENIIADKKISTRMSVNYFDFKTNGQYTVKISNLSERMIGVTIEFGDTSSSKLFVPGIVTAIGVTMTIFSAYRKIKNYNMAQPKENI